MGTFSNIMEANTTKSTQVTNLQFVRLKKTLLVSSAMVNRKISTEKITAYTWS